MNAGHTTHYFSLEPDTCQGNPISAYLFILALEIWFILTKSNKNIHDIKIFKHEYLYIAYADAYAEDISSAKIVLSLTGSFSKFSRLRPNISKCDTVGIDVLENVNVALCGMKNVDLTKETIKILGALISYNKKLQDDLNFRGSIKNIVNVIRLRRMRKLTLEGKATIFKSLAISKTVYLALLTTIPNSVTEELIQIQKMFLWGNKKPKIKHDTLCNKCNDGGLRNVDIVHKVVSLKCSWVRRLYNEHFRE